MSPAYSCTRVCFSKTGMVLLCHTWGNPLDKNSKVVVSIKWALNDDEIYQIRNPAMWDSASLLKSGSEVQLQHNLEQTSNFWFLVSPCSSMFWRSSQNFQEACSTLCNLLWITLANSDWTFMKTGPEVLTQLCLERVQNLLSALVS